MRFLQNLWNDPVKAFGVASIVLVLSLAIAPAKNHFSEWRHYQHAYSNLISGRADAVTLSKRMDHGIQQIWLPDQGLVDRCTTCHEGLKQASLRDVQEQPFRPHPAIPHKLTEFGCVTCHRGQGPATTVREAHYTTLAWEQPLLPAKYIESGCGQCHLAPMTGTPRLNFGRQLLAREGCVHCHTVKMPDGTVMQGTDFPPPLTHIADKTTREWMFAWLKDPRVYSSTATMPNFHLSDADISDVTAFLIAQSTPTPWTTATAAPTKAKAAAAPDAAAGASLYGEYFCATCHATQNAAGNLVGGDLAPELTKVGTKVKPEWLVGWLTNPGDYNPTTRMPHYRSDKGEIATLASFLEAKKDDSFVADVHLSPATPEQIAHGKKLVDEYGCATCHEINGISRPENFAPDLTRVGSKPFALLAFPPNVPHTLPDFLASKIRNPRAFGPSLKMPQFTLADQQVDAITTALLAQTDRAATQPATMRTAAVHETSYQPAGKAGQLIADLRCFSCHRINGRGGWPPNTTDTAPDLSFEGSAVQRTWLTSFLKNPETLRPALIRRMPKFDLSAAEINTLADYILAVYQTPAFDRDSSPVEATPALVEQGRQLFYGKFSCQSCHIVNPSQDKGYIGPALWAVGARLNSAWIYHWLKDPQALRPGTMEPNRHMNDDDASALTAFLSAQKSAPKTAGSKPAAGQQGAGR